MYIQRLILLSFIALFLNGCLVVQSKVEEDKKPDPGSAYLYGNFSLISSKNLNLSLTLQEYYKGEEIENPVEYYLVFNPENSLSLTMIELPPGQYNINSLQNLTRDMMGYNAMGSSRLFRTDEAIVIKLEAGKAYYLGDFTGTSNVSCSYNRCTYSWRLTSLRNSMETTTSQLKQKYRHFADIPTESLFMDIITQARQKVSRSSDSYEN